MYKWTLCVRVVKHTLIYVRALYTRACENIKVADKIDGKLNIT